MITFPIEYAYKGFSSLQPYLDMPLVCGSAQRIGTLIEYKPGEFGLVLGLTVSSIPIRKIDHLQFTALNGAQRIELQPVIICSKTNLVIVKAKNPEMLKDFHVKAVKLSDDFEVDDSEKIVLFQKDLNSLKDVKTTVKAKRFRFENAFCFSLSQKIETEDGLSLPGPLLNSEGKLIGYMVDQQVVSVFHIHYLMKQLLTENYQLFTQYPLIDFELMDLTSQNYHLYLPSGVIEETSISFGCSIQDCPSYPGYPFKRGDILIAIDGRRIEQQHINHATLGKISIEAAALLSDGDKLLFTLYREGKRCEIEVNKSLFSESNQYIQNKPKFAIINGVVFQVANSHLYTQLTQQGFSAERAYIKPANNHSLSKSYTYRKYENAETVLITETLSNDTLFNAEGSPFSVSTVTPFVVKKLNNSPIVNLEMLIKILAKIPVGSYYDLEGTLNDQMLKAYGIKVSDVHNKNILSSRAITQPSSEDIHLPEVNESKDDMTRSPVCLYRYDSAPLPKPLASSINNQSTDFSMQTAAMRGVLFIHATTKHRSSVQPYQYAADTKGTGSGFIIRHEEKNYIVTCAHVLGYTIEAQLKARFPEHSKDFELQVVMLNREQDIAILQVHPDLQTEFDEIAYPFSLDDSAIFPKKQSDILVIGFPGASAGEKTNPKIQPGKVTTIGYIPMQGSEYNRINCLVIQVNAATSGGNSGGPVVDAKTGAVIGVHSSGSTVAQLSNYSRPVIFLAKMLKKLQQSGMTPYPALPGIPFTLSFITDRKLKIAHGLEPDSLVGAKISALLSKIPGLEVGDILLELIDKDKCIYPVAGKGTIAIEENDISYRLFFELHEIGDPISIKVLRHGKEYVVDTKIDVSWPLSPNICSLRKDDNNVPYIKFCDKLVLANFDAGTTKILPAGSRSLVYYANKVQKQKREESSKVVILEILQNAYSELSSWITNRNTKELLFLNKINGISIRCLEDVSRIVAEQETPVFELECKSSATTGDKTIFRISNDNYYDTKERPVKKQKVSHL